MVAETFRRFDGSVGYQRLTLRELKVFKVFEGGEGLKLYFHIQQSCKLEILSSCA